MMKHSERVGFKLTKRDWHCYQCGRDYERERLLKYMKEHSFAYHDGWFHLGDLIADIEAAGENKIKYNMAAKVADDE